MVIFIDILVTDKACNFLKKCYIRNMNKRTIDWEQLVADITGIGFCLLGWGLFLDLILGFTG